MVSLLKLAKVTEEGVKFSSPYDATPMYVYPNIYDHEALQDDI